MTNRYPWRENTSQNTADQDDPRYETPGGAQHKVDIHVSRTNNIANKAVTQPKIADWAVGARQIDPSLLEHYGDIATNAKFEVIDEQFAEITKDKDLYPTMTKSEIQGYIDQFTSLKFKTGTYNIDLSVDGIGFSIPSNRTVIFEENAVINVLPNNRSGYDTILLSNVSNVRIEYANLTGDKHTHTGTLGEWGQGVSIKDNCQNITIIRPNLKSFWGDGVYVNGVLNCIIDYPIIDDCRRNGISVVSAENCTINEPIITNTGGTNPQAGIDIEPNTPQEVLKNVKVIGGYFKGNAQFGIQVYLQYQDTTSEPIDVQIINTTFDGDNFTINGVSSPKKGYVKLDKAYFKNMPILAINIRDKVVDAVQLDITDCYVEDYNQLNSSVNTNAIQLFVSSTAFVSGLLGGIRIIRPIINTSSTTTLFGIRFEDSRAVPSLFSKIEVIDPEIKGPTRTKVSMGKNDGTCYVKYDDRLEKTNVSSSLFEFKNDAPFVKMTASNPSVFVDKDKVATNPLQEYTIIVAGAGATIRFQEYQGSIKPLKAFPLSATAVNTLVTSNTGAMIKFKKTADDAITITQMVGTWTAT